MSSDVCIFPMEHQHSALSRGLCARPDDTTTIGFMRQRITTRLVSDGQHSSAIGTPNLPPGPPPFLASPPRRQRGYPRRVRQKTPSWMRSSLGRPTRPSHSRSSLGVSHPDETNRSNRRRFARDHVSQISNQSSERGDSSCVTGHRRLTPHPHEKQPRLSHRDLPDGISAL